MKGSEILGGDGGRQFIRRGKRAGGCVVSAFRAESQEPCCCASASAAAASAIPPADCCSKEEPCCGGETRKGKSGLLHHLKEKVHHLKK